MDHAYLPLLLDGKNEYITQFVSLIRDPLFESILAMYREARREAEQIYDPRQTIVLFQRRLLEAREWTVAPSESIEKDKFTRMMYERIGVSWLSDLVTAIFVMQIKILSLASSVDINKELSFSIPRYERLFCQIYHRMVKEYIGMAFMFTECDIVDDISPVDYQRNLLHCRSIIEPIILETISREMPMAELLEAFKEENEISVFSTNKDISRISVRETADSNGKTPKPKESPKRKKGAGTSISSKSESTSLSPSSSSSSPSSSSPSSSSSSPSSSSSSPSSSSSLQETVTTSKKNESILPVSLSESDTFIVGPPTLTNKKDSAPIIKKRTPDSQKNMNEVSLDSIQSDVKALPKIIDIENEKKQFDSMNV